MSSPSKKYRRLLKYIDSDDLGKIKHVIRKYEIDNLNVKVSGNGSYLIHYASLNGSLECIKYFIEEGVDLGVVDDDYNLPIHFLILRGIQNETSSDWIDLLTLCMEKNPSCLDKENCQGQTPRALLSSLHEREAEEPVSGADAEREWREKLADECMNDYNLNWGDYEEDFNQCNRPSNRYETNDQWADRIHREYRKKTYTSYQRTSKPKRSEQESSSSKSSKSAKRDREKAEKKKQKEKNLKEEILTHKRSLQYVIICFNEYEAKWSEFMKTDETSTLLVRHIPWPSDEVWSYFEQHRSKMDESDYKKLLREQQIRWHPDKFEQRFGVRLQPSEKEFVLQRVNDISQKINNIMTSFQSQ